MSTATLESPSSRRRTRTTTPERLTQAQLASYWSCRRFVESIHEKIRSGAVTESGPLTIPELTSTTEVNSVLG